MSEENWIDVETLTTLKEVMEDEFSVVIDAFFEQANSGWSQAAAQLSTQDLPALTRSAHSLKGSALSLGAQPLCESLEALEHAAREGCEPKCADLLAIVERQLRNTLQALKAWMA